MSLNNVLPFLSTFVMFIFTASVLQRYVVRRRPAFLFWGIGLALFGLGSFAEAYLALAWSPLVFYLWYLGGAVLNAAWLGHGTVKLLFGRRRWTDVLTVILVVGSLAVTGLMLATPLDAGQFQPGVAISEQYRQIMPPGAPVRMTTPFFNIYGLLTLAGGAIYSAYLFWRKRVLPNRVIGNILIAAGALSIGFASSLTRLGIGQYLYIGELLAAVLMYTGFRAAAAPNAERALASESAPAAGD
ncbi:MAG: hypothetical protein HPY64_09320 [Anaerolineae bacterium]|nr:hypothetical protein [Anaerolineae bacterium]